MSGEVARPCVTCQEVKPVSDFGLLARRPDGLNIRCKSCVNAYAADYRQRNRAKVNERERWRFILDTYGLTREQYESMLEAQGGGCAICGGQSPDGRRLSVDHCHSTGRARGLLCTNCNNGLGRFKDDVDLLAVAINYLEVHK